MWFYIVFFFSKCSRRYTMPRKLIFLFFFYILFSILEEMQFLIWLICWCTQLYKTFFFQLFSQLISLSLSGWRKMLQTDARVILMQWPKYEGRLSFSKVSKFKEETEPVALQGKENKALLTTCYEIYWSLGIMTVFCLCNGYCWVVVI